MRESEENSPLKNLKFQDYAYFSYADTVVFFRVNFIMAFCVVFQK